ncbi:amino acid adenylation domain-containing protein [Colwelliaceae bacterium MEBiC 14330]
MNQEHVNTQHSHANNIETIYPLTPVQQGMLFHTLMQPGSGIYLQQYRYIMEMENLDIAAFENAWQAVVDRHQVLRSAFVHETQEQPLQVVFKNIKVPFQYLDWQGLDEQTQQGQVEQLLKDERKQGMAFNQAPLMQVTLIQLSENRYQFIRSYHHILMDAWCFSLIMVEFLSCYRQFSQGKTIELPPVVQYQAYIEWLQQHNNQEAEQQFWQEKLANFDEPTPLGIQQVNRFADEPFDALSKDVSCTLSNEQTRQLKTIANQCKVTLNTLLQGVWAQTLARYSQTQDVVFGITVSGRSIELTGIEKIVGLFINTLPLRVAVDNSKTLASWLQQLQADNLSIREHEQTSLAMIQQWSDVDDQPLFNSIFVYENAPMDKALALENLDFKVEDGQNRSDLNYPLTVTVLPQDNLHIELTYRCIDFEHGSVSTMLDYYQATLINLCQLSQAADTKLAHIEPLYQATPQLDTPRFNTSGFSSLHGKQVAEIPCAPQLFVQMAQQQPDANAVSMGSDSLTYQQLERKSNQLAHYLTEKYDIKPDTLVGLCVNPSIDMVIAIWAILKAGGAYVPLDPSYPMQRLSYMIEDADLNLILSQESLAQHEIFVKAPEKLLTIDDADTGNFLASYPSENAPDVSVSSNHLAYVIYTSGTTGKPKGVMVEHAQLSNFLINVKQRYRIDAQDKVLQFSTINFDISVEECFGALCFGAELVIRDQDCISDPVKFFDFCDQQQISVISLPTAYWHQLVSYPHNKLPSALRMVIVGGEALKLALVNHWFTHFNGVELVNTYGPTEATVTASGYHLTQSYQETGEVPIGQANINTRLLVLDKDLTPVPQGVIGELFIGGGSIARGYLNREDLTQERFVYSPSIPDQRLYRSGDLVRLNDKGQLEFNGRIDDQVKIRGYRIELGEIETVIQRQANIKQCLVIAWQRESGEKALAAYYTCQQKQSSQALRQLISEQLASYMVPAVFIEMENFPLTGNGKIDKKALPSPQQANDNAQYNDKAENTYIPPRNAMEQVIVDCWSSVLALEKISIDDNFFALGGHSLLVIQVLSALRKQGVIVEAAQLFKTPTPKTLAQAISDKLANSAIDNLDGNKTTNEIITGGLIPENCQKITTEMLPLLTLDQQQLDVITEKVALGSTSIADIYPLAPLQEGILFHHILSPSNDPYIVKALLAINNSALFERFVAGLNYVISRHEVLRTNVLWRQLDKPVQVVNRHVDIDIEWLDLSEALANGQADICQCMQNYHLQLAHDKALATDNNAIELDLETSPLLKLSVAKDPHSDKHAVMFIEHHIISDHVSVDIIMKELAAFLNDETDSLKPSIPYRNFVSHALTQQHHQAQHYFSDVLGHINYPSLPYELADTQGDANHNDQLKFSLESNLSQAIRQLCRQQSTTPANFFHGAWALVVARACAHSEIVFGTVMSGRLQNIENADAMLGMFINTLPFTINVNELTAAQLLAQTKANLQGLIPHEQTSLALAQRCSQLSGEQPLFSALLNYRHSSPATAAENKVNAAEFSGIELLNVVEPSNYPFTLSVDDFGEHSPEFSLTLELDKAVSCRQIQQELTTAISLFTTQLSEASQQPILNDYLTLSSSLTPDDNWIVAKAMVFEDINAKANTLTETNQVNDDVATEQLQSEAEHVLAKIWQEILDLSVINRSDNFFELGGHSLLIMQMITKLQQHGFELSASQVFTSPVLKDLALSINTVDETAVINAEQTDWIPTESEAITPEMLPLIDISQEDIDAIVAQVDGGVSNIQDIYPLAPLQQGILFHHRMDAEQDPYVMPAYLKIKGSEQFEQFVAAINLIIARHDTLRTAILWRSLSQPVQVVLRSASLPINWLTLSPEQDFLTQMQTLDEQQVLSMNIEQAPLINITVAHDVNNDEYVIRMLDHHIISDHVSMNIVQKELALIFANNTASLPKPVQYRGFIAQLLACDDKAQQQAAKSFFTQQLQGFTQPSIPYESGAKNSHNNSDSQQHSLRLEERDLWLPAALSEAIRAKAKQLKLNPATLFHSAFAMVIAACSNKEDVVFGTVMSGRLQGTSSASVEHMMGMFINTLPVRLNLTEVSPYDFVKQTQQALHAIIPFEQTPLSEIQQCSELTAETPLFNAMINYRHTAKKQTDSDNSLIGLQFIDPKERTNYPFAISIDDYGDDFLVNVQIEQSIGDDRVDRVCTYMETALRQLLAALQYDDAHADADESALNNTLNNNQAILAYSVVPKAEQVELLTLNYQAVDYPNSACIYDLFEQQAKISAADSALVFNEQSLSYQVFDEKTNQLAHYLIEQGVTEDSYVALCMDRSFDMVIAIWAVLKAGGAYLPIDVDLPQARIINIVQDSQAKLMLTQQHLVNRLDQLSEQTTTALLALDNDKTQTSLSGYSSASITRVKQQSALSSAYLIYTSGSTGQPKGVVCSHQGLVNRVDWMQKHYQLQSGDRVLQKTPYNFDVSVWEFVWPLIVGATLVIAEPEGHKNPRYLTDVIETQSISHLHFVPSMLSLMLTAGDWARCSSVSKVFCSGEALSHELQSTFFAQQAQANTNAELHNLYGPTEAAIDVSYWQCQPDLDSAIVPIGKPIQNTQLVVLDEQQKLTPKGVEGELYIGGVGLARGYLNQAELTEQRFIAHPFKALLANCKPLITSERLYRTGDSVRLLNDGNIEYLGRLDHQVKIRGLRIELGEIEYTLNQHQAIRSSQLLVKLDQREEANLVAYVELSIVDNDTVTDTDNTDVSASQGLLSDTLINEFKDLLNAHLPSYMVPNHYVQITQWPLSKNGKIDRKLLPAPEFIVSSQSVIAPSTPEQQTLVKIWSDLLVIPQENISIDSNFFELGGHSILAMKLVSAIETEFNLSLSLKSLFSSPTISTIAQQIAAEHQTQNDDVDFMEQLLNEFEEQE